MVREVASRTAGFNRNYGHECHEKKHDNADCHATSGFGDEMYRVRKRMGWHVALV